MAIASQSVISQRVDILRRKKLQNLQFLFFARVFPIYSTPFPQNAPPLSTDPADFYTGNYGAIASSWLFVDFYRMPLFMRKAGWIMKKCNKNKLKSLIVSWGCFGDKRFRHSWQRWQPSPPLTHNNSTTPYMRSQPIPDRGDFTHRRIRLNQKESAVFGCVGKPKS